VHFAFHNLPAGGAHGMDRSNPIVYQQKVGSDAQPSTIVTTGLRERKWYQRANL
jgi:hypothetical protein